MSHRWSTTSIPSRAACRLDFVIVGAGIAGLAAGVELCRSGHSVRIFEKASQLEQRSASGLRVPPNLSKLLVEWGLGDELKSAGVRSDGVYFESMESGEHVGSLFWTEEVLNEFEGDFFFVHHNDLRRMLYKLLTSTGGTVDFGRAVVEIIPPDISSDQTAGPQIILEGGEITIADVVVAADGAASALRTAIVDPSPSSTTNSAGTAPSQYIYGATVSTERMKVKPSLAGMVDSSIWWMWMGNDSQVKAYPVSGRKEFAIHFCRPSGKTRTVEAGSWSGTSIPASEVDVGSCEPRIQDLFSLASELAVYSSSQTAPVSEWVDDSGRIVLIGEAAHPSFPYNMHCASLAVEDGVVLGRLFARVRSPGQITQLLDAFEELRAGRTTAVNEFELSNKALTGLPPGPYRDGRDAAFRAAENRRKSVESGEAIWSDEELMVQWGEVGRIYAYNASEAVDDWYMKWGDLSERGLDDNVHVNEDGGSLFDFGKGLSMSVAEITTT